MTTFTLPSLAAVLLTSVATWLQTPERGALLTLGLLGTFAVARADARAPLTAWRRRYRHVPFVGIRRFPRDRRGVEALARVCTAAAALGEEVETLPRALRARMRRQVADLVRLAATLTVQRERLNGEVEAPLRALREQLDRQIVSVVPEVLRLRATVLRTSAVAATVAEPLAAVREAETELRAAVECDEELRALEGVRWSARAS